MLFKIKPPVITTSIVQLEKKKAVAELCTHKYTWTSQHMQTGWTAFGLDDHAFCPFLSPQKTQPMLPQGAALLPGTSPCLWGCTPCLQRSPEPGGPLGCSTHLQPMSRSVWLWCCSEQLMGAMGVFGQRSCSSAWVL